jgi:excisionase family DNA binding protein
LRVAAQCFFKNVMTMKLIEILENRKEALKVSEVAKMLGVTPQHIYKMAAAGLIPCFHVRGAIRFCPSDLADWIKKEIAASTHARNPNGNEGGLKVGS